jgi:hypothetical protein
VASAAPAAGSSNLDVSACGWDRIQPGERVSYRLAEEGMSGGKAIRVGGDIVQTSAPNSAGAIFRLQVLAREGDVAWADVSFENTPKLPTGIPNHFTLEIHTGSNTAKADPWVFAHGDAIRPAQLTVEGHTFACDDHVNTDDATPQHTCLQSGPTCLFWLDGLVRHYQYPNKTSNVRQMLELTGFGPASPSQTPVKVAEVPGNHFSGTWYSRRDPFKLNRIRYYLEAGKLVREVQHYKRMGPAPMKGAELTAEANAWAHDGEPTTESISFRDWVLDLLHGKDPGTKWAPSESAPSVTFLAFPQ